MKNFDDNNDEAYPVDEELTGSSFLASAQAASPEKVNEIDV